MHTLLKLSAVILPQAPAAGSSSSASFSLSSSSASSTTPASETSAAERLLGYLPPLSVPGLPPLPNLASHGQKESPALGHTAPLESLLDYAAELETAIASMCLGFPPLSSFVCRSPGVAFLFASALFFLLVISCPRLRTTRGLFRPEVLHFCFPWLIVFFPVLLV